MGGDALGEDHPEPAPRLLVAGRDQCRFGLLTILEVITAHASAASLAARFPDHGPTAEQVLLDFLTTSRWCPITDKESMY